MKKNLFKRGMAGLLSLVMCLTTLVGIGTTTAYAAGERAEVYLVSFPRSGDANIDYSGTWGHPNLRYMYGWHSGESKYTTIRAMHSYDGNICYCIEPGVQQDTGDTYTSKDETFWDNLPSDINSTISPYDIKLFIGRIMQYGYTGPISTSWRSQNPADAATLAEAMATQVLIWETVVGERDEDFDYVSPGSYDAVKGVISTAHPLYDLFCDYYDSIEASVQRHSAIPSFMSKNPNRAQSVELEWDGSSYTATLTDHNRVLSDYSFSANEDGISFSVSGNQLVITATDAPSDSVRITANKVGSSRRGVITWTDGTFNQGSGKQDVITYAQSVSDPVQAFLNLKVSYGSAKIVKTSEDGKVDNLNFTVTGNGINQTVKTNSKGEIQIDNLMPGVYTVTEMDYDKYEPQESRRVTVVSGQVSTVTFNNKLKRGDLQIVKSSEDNLNEGVTFHLYGTSLSGIAVDEYEEYRFKSFRHSLLVVLLSIAAMVAGVILLGQMLQTQTNEAFLYLGGACLLILVGVYELHRQIPLLLHRFAKQNLRHKYKEENLFFLGQIGRRIHSAGRTMAVVAILLTISLATMFVGLTMGAGYKANMKAYYPYDAGVAIDAPLEKSNMDSIVSFTEEHCGVEDSVSYYLYAVPEKPIEALSLSDYNHLREILGLSPVVMGNNEFLVHCDTWNYMDGIRQGLKQQPEITLNGRTLTIAETPILTEPMEQYQMAGTKGYVLVLPDEAASQLVGEKIRLAMKLEDGGYPELKSDLKQFLNSGKWQPELQSGQQLPEKVTMDVTVKAWGVANSLTGFTAISFCGLYLSIIFIILSCSVLAFEQLSAIDKNQKNYAVIDRLGVPSHRQASLIRRELSTVFLIPLLFPLLLTVLLIAGAQFFFGEAILQQGLVPLYGLVTILLFCAIYLTYFGATMFLFKRVILRPEMR